MTPQILCVNLQDSTDNLIQEQIDKKEIDPLQRFPGNNLKMFLFGHDVVKGALGRIIDNVNACDGVVVFFMSDLPVGFRIAGEIDSGL